MDPKTNFKLIIIQTELERFKFLVRSFLRARIGKVCLFLSTCWRVKCADTDFFRLIHIHCISKLSIRLLWILFSRYFRLPSTSTSHLISRCCQRTTHRLS